MAVPAAELAIRLAARRAAYPQEWVKDAFGAALLALGAERPDLVALTGDLMYATGIEAFAAAYPERFVNVGIAEQNLTGVAAGLASCGKRPVVCGYAAFTTLRAIEQARDDCAYNDVPVILAGFSAGLSYGVGGPTHQTLEDLAMMRAIPNMTVVVPADPPEVGRALRAALELARPVYVRLGRGPEHAWSTSEVPFQIGRATELRSGPDLCLIASGPMVLEMLLAAEELAEEGIRATVLNIHTVKPIDRDAILAAAARCRAMIVLEEHSVIGGLGAAVLEVLDGGHTFPVRRIGVEDRWPPIGPTFQLRAALGLCAENVVLQARALLGLAPPPSSPPA